MCMLLTWCNWNLHWFSSMPMYSTGIIMLSKEPGPHYNMNTFSYSYQYRNSHCKDDITTVLSAHWNFLPTVCHVYLLLIVFLSGNRYIEIPYWKKMYSYSMLWKSPQSLFSYYALVTLFLCYRRGMVLVLFCLKNKLNTIQYFRDLPLLTSHAALTLYLCCIPV